MKEQSILVGQLIGKALVSENVFIDKRVKMRGFFSLGNHSSILSDCWINNTVIGNYSRIDKGVQLGFPKLYTGSFSNHYFCFSEGRNYFSDEEYDGNPPTKP